MGFIIGKTINGTPSVEFLKKIYTLLTSGGNTTIPHLIPSDTDKFETFVRNHATLLELPNSINSNNKNRFNELISVQKRSTFNFDISSTNTDMTTNLTLTGTQTVVFLFDGTKWIHIKTSN